jgi:hypothetical protein
MNGHLIPLSLAATYLALVCYIGKMDLHNRDSLTREALSKIQQAFHWDATAKSPEQIGALPSRVRDHMLEY